MVRAFHAGLPLARAARPDVIVKLDADLSFATNYFEGLLAEFAAAPVLGIASGVCLERDASGSWQRRYGTGTGVWGACRAYRTACLDEIGPLEERQGWDEIDALKAVVRGWRTTASSSFGSTTTVERANATAPAFACGVPKEKSLTSSATARRTWFSAPCSARANRPLPRSPPGTSELLSPGRPS